VTATNQGRLTLAAMAATLLAAVTLGPLVRGLGWYVAVFAVTAAIAGTGAGVRQLTRWWPVVVLAQLTVLILAITALFARDAAMLGLLPGPAAVDALTGLVRDGMAIARQGAPPVPATRGVILLVAGGMGIAALIVDVIAVSMRRPAVAGLPLLAVYCVPAAILSGGLGWGYFVVAGAGFLMLVGADSTDRIRAWGHVLSAPNPGGSDRALGGPLSGARRVGAASLAAAVVLPVFVPGLGGQLISGGTGEGPGDGGNITVINPILDLQADLNSRRDTPVIRYKTNAKQPEPLRIVTDDLFDGSQWAPRVGPLPRDQKVQEQMPAPPGLSTSVPTVQLETTFQVGALHQTYLPLPYPTTKVQIAGRWLWEGTTLNVVGDNVTTEGKQYTAQHLGVSPTATQLRAAGSVIPGTLPETYTELPEKLSPKIKEIATKVAGEGSGYDRALKVQEYFRSTGGFLYNTKIAAPKGKDGGQDAVLAFLENKQGYCVQFASAMAVMARTLGIPSRVAVGFLPGEKLADGSYEISLKDAHAWPELYFDGVGWTRFEPTPATRAPQVPVWARPATKTPEVAPAPSASAATGGPSPSATTSKAPAADPTSGASDEESLLGRVLGAVPWQSLWILALLVALLGVPLAATQVARRARWRRARTAVARAEAAWEELRERLGDLGVRWAASWTPRALQLRLVSDHQLDAPTQAALGRLVEDIEHARYAPPDQQGRGAGELREDVHAVARAVTVASEKRARRRARWFPRSGIAALTSVARRVDVAADEAGRRAADMGSDARRAVTSGRR
jgi:transglutaminase-like putative cysteine protease